MQSFKEKPGSEWVWVVLRVQRDALCTCSLSFEILLGLLLNCFRRSHMSYIRSLWDWTHVVFPFWIEGRCEKLAFGVRSKMGGPHPGCLWGSAPPWVFIPLSPVLVPCLWDGGDDLTQSLDFIKKWKLKQVKQKYQGGWQGTRLSCRLPWI